MHKNGFGLLEIIISVAIIGIIGASLVQLGIVSLWLSQRSSDQTQTGFILQEGAAAVKFLRNESWDTNIGPLTVGTTYYVVWNSTSYELTETAPPLINNRYKRTLIFEEVLRDASNNIAASGTIDPQTKKVIINTEWPYKGGIKNKQINFYIMNIFGN